MRHGDIKMDDAMKEKGVELLGKLSQAHGAPGQENEVRRIFRSELGEGVFTDRAGNIFCERKGSSDHPRILIAAHMDEVGLIVQTVMDDGLIRFHVLGGWGRTRFLPNECESAPGRESRSPA